MENNGGPMEPLIREALSNSWNALLQLKPPIAALPKVPAADGDSHLALNHFIAQSHSLGIDQNVPILERWS